MMKRKEIQKIAVLKLSALEHEMKNLVAEWYVGNPVKVKIRRGQVMVHTKAGLETGKLYDNVNGDTFLVKRVQEVRLPYWGDKSFRYALAVEATVGEDKRIITGYVNEVDIDEGK